jgi:hypothetical protein
VRGFLRLLQLGRFLLAPLSFRPLLDWKWMNIAVTNALPQGSLQIGWSAMLPEKVAKRLLGESLKIHAAVKAKE